MYNLQGMFARLNNNGGQLQQDRMILNKKKSLERAVKYSYQGAKIQFIDSDKQFSALMNPNKLLADYDEKILSIAFDDDVKTGKVFRWINPAKNNNDTYWIIYLQDLAELAYFKASVRKCNYSISFIDECTKQEKKFYISIKGPKEEGIKSVTSGLVNIDIPNYTLSILVEKNEDTLKYFKRYAKFYLQGLNENDKPICWRVEATDSISLPGILEVYAKEYYINNNEDDVKNGIVGGLIQPILSPEQIIEENKEIVGDNFIKPNFVYQYTYIGTESVDWKYDHTLPITVQVINDNTIALTWIANYTGQFDLFCGNSHKTIVVESLL